MCFRQQRNTLLTLAEHRALQASQQTKRPSVYFPADHAAAAAAADEPAPPNGDVQMWCGAEDALGVWRSLPAVVAAMHVEASAGHTTFDYKIEPHDLSPEYRKLANDPTIRFVIYNGQSDANVPYNGQVQYWETKETGFEIVDDWSPWYRNGPAAPAGGHVRTYSGGGGAQFKFVTVSGAGHEVPTYRPEAALTMLTGFVLSDKGGGPDHAHRQEL